MVSVKVLKARRRLVRGSFRDAGPPLSGLRGYGNDRQDFFWSEGGSRGTMRSASRPLSKRAKAAALPISHYFSWPPVAPPLNLLRHLGEGGFITVSMKPAWIDDLVVSPGESQSWRMGITGETSKACCWPPTHSKAI